MITYVNDGYNWAYFLLLIDLAQLQALLLLYFSPGLCHVIVSRYSLGSIVVLMLYHSKFIACRRPVSYMRVPSRSSIVFLLRGRYAAAIPIDFLERGVLNLVGQHLGRGNRCGACSHNIIRVFLICLSVCSMRIFNLKTKRRGKILMWTLPGAEVVTAWCGSFQHKKWELGLWLG